MKILNISSRSCISEEIFVSVEVEAGSMKPFCCHSRSWIDENSTFLMEAGLIRKF